MPIHEVRIENHILQIKYKICPVCAKPYLITRSDKETCSNNCAAKKIKRDRERLIKLGKSVVNKAKNG